MDRKLPTINGENKMEIKFDLMDEKQRETVYNIIRNFAGYASVKFGEPKAAPGVLKQQEDGKYNLVAAPVVPVAPAPAAPAAPAPPTPAPAAPAPTPIAPVTGCPFTDPAGFMKYVMESYQILGAAKGAAIQGIFNEFGCDHLSKVTPELYPQVWAKIEALKS